MTRVLIVEDDPLIGLDLSSELSGSGFTVVGVATTAPSGLELLAAQGCDVAVLDVNLGNHTSAPVASEMTARGLPFVVVSGYSADQHPEAFKGAPFLGKPVETGLLIAQIRALVRDCQG